MNRKFSKIVVAKYSPQNGCNVNEGEILIVKPRKTIPIKNYVPHHFISTLHPALKSKYGWVEDVDPFTLEEFVKKHIGEKSVSDDELNHLRTMLLSIEKLPADTPVATDYNKYGVVEQKMVLTVHKVIFYKVKM